MQVEVDVTCMHTNFGGHSLSGFGDKISFKIWSNFPFRPWTTVHGGQKIELGQKIHGSRSRMQRVHVQYMYHHSLSLVDAPSLSLSSFLFCSSSNSFSLVS